VGRERELAELRAGLADVTAGHSHLFLLSGEPGIGKTRLADEFGRLAVAQGVRVTWGRCWEGDGAPAYWPWIQVLRACLTGSDAEQRAAILGAEATPQVAQDIAQLLPEVRATHATTPRPPGPQPTDPEQARFQLFESVTTVLKNVASIGPLVIVIDDLHDTDHPSLLLLKFIAAHSKDARILLVGTYRNTEVRQSQELTRLIGELSREGHSIPIVGLSEAEVGEFLTSRSGKKADEKLVANLYQATDGNPLFVDGVVRLLVAEGKLERAVTGEAFKIPRGTHSRRKEEGEK
jgi:predicted ATPase